MSRQRAWLVDVYETALTVDSDLVWSRLAERAALPVEDFRRAADTHAERAMIGVSTLRDAFAAALQTYAPPADPELVADLVDLDAELMASSCVVFDDALAFIDERRAAGDRVALVSNCAQNTRPLLDAIGLSSRVDALVLSCEVGVTKPDRAIYEAALSALGAVPSSATHIDDQLRFCEGALAVGISAIRIDRTATQSRSTTSSIPVVTGFDAVASP